MPPVRGPREQVLVLGVEIPRIWGQGRPAILLLAVAILAAPAFTQQMPAYTEAGPVPTAITSGTSIFVSNGGAENELFPHPFTGYGDRAYTEFFAALQATKKYALVGAPEKADLVLELHLTAPFSFEEVREPRFKLVVYDPQTHFTLWTCTREIALGSSQKDSDRNFDGALDLLLHRFLQIAGKGPDAAAPMTPIK